MAKQQENPASILILFYEGGTRASMGTKHSPDELEKKMSESKLSGHDVKIETTNEDETVEKDTAFLDLKHLLFYSIRVPRPISNLITDTPKLSLDSSVQ